MTNLTYPGWPELEAAADQLRQTRISDLFKDDPRRVDDFCAEAPGLFLDYSSHLLDRKALALLGRVLNEAGIAAATADLVSGKRINLTEDRAALHTLLRAKPEDVPADLQDMYQEVQDTLDKMADISDRLRSGAWTGSTGRPIRQVVALGIGGSYLGPHMVDEALASLRGEDDIATHFVANVDAHHLTDVLSGLDQEETLVVVVSKTFTTLETRCNADTTREWLLQKLPENKLGAHLVGVTTNLEAADRFGIEPQNILPMWDWVGGRYSLWSAVGLPIAIRYGMDTFNKVLEGARAMDLHFQSAPFEKNLPQLMAMLGIWYQHFFEADTHTVLTYDHRLRLLPDHLQQLDMESNGKSVTKAGEPVNYPTGAIIWGGEGTNGQHAFHQLLHQGTRQVPIDFLVALTPDHQHQEHHDHLVACCLSQAQALMVGRSRDDMDDNPVNDHRVMPGNRPSSMLMIDHLDAGTVGALVALYEHKVFCQAQIWQINPFDQWGVELGKELGGQVYAAIQGDTEQPLPPGTKNLVNRYRQFTSRKEH